MSRANEVAAQLKAAFPGIRVSSTDRTPAEQAALVRSGATRATNSQHMHGNGIDLVLPKGVSPTQVRSWLNDQGINPGEFLNESGRGSNQGTGAHLHIGLAPRANAKGGDPASGGGGRNASPSQSVQAWRDQRNARPDLEQLPDIRDVLATKLKQSTPIPAEVIASYNSHKMEPEDRAIVDKYLADGTWYVPKGQRLQAPAARTTSELLGMGTRSLMEGTGGLVDSLAAGPLNRTINAVTGANLSTSPVRSLASSAADSAGFARPESSTEQLYAAAQEGGVQGLLTAGLGSAASGVNGATGIIGRGLASSPILDTASGVTSGVAAESARQAGVGPVGQMAAGVMGGAAPIALAKAAERFRAPKTLPDVVAETPREVMLTPDGELTPHGQEVAARHGVGPDDVRAAYDAPPTVQRGVANDGAVSVPQARVTGERPIAPDAPDAPAPRPVDTPEARAMPRDVAPDAPPMHAADAPDLPQNALARVNAGKDIGVDYSRGQATKNFDIQDKEQRLRASNGPEGDAARAFAAKQADQVKGAVDDFKRAMGDDPSLSKQERGQLAQDSIRELRDSGQEGVRAIYTELGELGAGKQIDRDAVSGAFERALHELDIPSEVREVIKQEGARYGLLGKPVSLDDTGRVTSQTGLTKVRTADGETITFVGEPQQLDVAGASNLRTTISRLYSKDGPLKKTQALKAAVDDAVSDALEKAATSDNPALATKAKEATAAAKQQIKTFRSKDVIQDLIDWKKGAEGQTPKIDPDQVMTRAFRSTSDLKRVKAVLLSSGTEKSKAAWQVIKGHGVAQIFDQATTRNSNIAGEITEAISGSKLRTAIDKFGADKLKVLLDPEELDRLMKIRRVVEDVTVPIGGTTNPSGSGLLVMRLMSGIVGRIPGAGGLINMGAAVANHAKQIADRADTVKGLNYTPAAAAAETVPAGSGKAAGMLAKGAAKSGEYIKSFIDTFKTPDVLTPVLVSTQSPQRKEQ